MERLEREHSVRLNVSPRGEPFLPFARRRFRNAVGQMRVRRGGLEYAPPHGIAVGRRRLCDASIRWS